MLKLNGSLEKLEELKLKNLKEAWEASLNAFKSLRSLRSIMKTLRSLNAKASITGARQRSNCVLFLFLEPPRGGGRAERDPKDTQGGFG